MKNSMITLMARQAIHDKEGVVKAYELLYRDGWSVASQVDNSDMNAGDRATSSIITQLFTNLDINEVIGNKSAFINFTYNHLVNEIPKLLPKDRIIIEVIEDIPINNQLIHSLIVLHKAGYRIALDDFIYKEQAAPLIQIADIIKIDVLHQNKQQIECQLASLKDFHGKLLAEKIESRSQFQDCIDLGFDYFQGFFLNQPDLVRGQALSENKMHLVRLFNEVNNPRTTIKQIEEIILQIPKLSYRILRVVNSVSLYKGTKIESLVDAIKYLGLFQVRNWLILLLLSSTDNVELDLLERTLIRAKMCEELAKINNVNPHLAYTVGIFSTLEAIFHEPMASLLAKIQLSSQLNDALLYLEGELGKILKLVVDYETANFKQLEFAAIGSHLLTAIYLRSVKYSLEITRLIL